MSGTEGHAKYLGLRKKGSGRTSEGCASIPSSLEGLARWAQMTAFRCPGELWACHPCSERILDSLWQKGTNPGPFPCLYPAHWF